MNTSRSYGQFIPILFLALGFGVLMVFAGYKGAIPLALLGPTLLTFAVAIQRPVYFVFLAISMAFLISFLSRYFPTIPFGLSIDAFLVFALVGVAFHQKIKIANGVLRSPLLIANLIWLGFTVLELGNPEVTSRVAWFYANRGLSFYPVLFLVLALLLMRNPKWLNRMLIAWAILSLAGSLYGIKQQFFGVSGVEQQWLNNGAASTHILFGRLRIFSFYSDTAQFAANQAHTALVFAIIGLFPGHAFRTRILCWFTAVLALYGMVITGTRGVLAVLAIGGFMYLIMTRNFRIILAGLALGAGFFVFLKFTSIGQSNYQINRMRTALDFNDPSFQVRKQREEVLKSYLSARPLGGGIGSAGFWGKRFSPGTFLAELGTDGHYTRIWMETGSVGLSLYLGIMIFVLLYLGRRLWQMPASRKKQTLVALFCGFTGLLAASYTNGLITQLPTGPLVFTSLGLIEIGSAKKIRSA